MAIGAKRVNVPSLPKKARKELRIAPSRAAIVADPDHRPPIAEVATAAAKRASWRRSTR